MRFNSGDTSLWFIDWTGLGPLCHFVDFVHISDTQLRVQICGIKVIGSWIEWPHYYL